MAHVPDDVIELQGFADEDRAQLRHLPSALILVFAVVIGAWGVALLVPLLPLGFYIPSLPILVVQWISIVVFAASFLLILLGPHLAKAIYPLVLFGLLQETMFAAFSIGWSIAAQVLSPAIWDNYGRVVFIVLGAHAVVFSLILIVSLINSAIRGRGAVWATAGPDRPAADDEIRRRIKKYFRRGLFWPWLLVPGSLVLLGMVVFQPPESLTQMLSTNWTSIVNGLLLLAVWHVLAHGGAHLRVLDLATFLILAYCVDTVFSLAVETFVKPIYGDDFWSTQWPFYYSWYLLVLAIVAAIYGIVYRLVVHPYWRRASQSEVENVTKADTDPMLDHGLSRLGVNRRLLLAEPLMLRGIPDRDAIGGTFVGWHTDKDDVLRFTPQRCTVIAFSDDQVHFYEGTIDLTTGHIVNESVVEFFYQDISNVARAKGSQTIDRSQAMTLRGALFSLFSPRTASRRQHFEALAINDTLQVEGRDVFQINLESGRALVVVLRDDSFFDKRLGRLIGVLKSIGVRPAQAATSRAPYRTDLPTNENERVIASIRTLIRDKKRSLLVERT